MTGVQTCALPISLIKDNLNNNKKTFIVTANPETFSYGKEEDFNELLLDENTTIVPDGIGIVKASRMLGYDVKERIPGIDIAVKLLEYSNELKKKVYLFGAKQEIIDKMKNKTLFTTFFAIVFIIISFVLSAFNKFIYIFLIIMVPIFLYSIKQLIVKIKDFTKKAPRLK